MNLYKKQSYNTKARKYILEYLKEHKDVTVSAADIIMHLKSLGITVDQATVYRCLNRLVGDEMLLKFTQNGDKATVYQYKEPCRSCDEHIHIKCVKCGRLMHLECEFMRDIKQHLETEHGFTLMCGGSILYGICDKCK